MSCGVIRSSRSMSPSFGTISLRLSANGERIVDVLAAIHAVDYESVGLGEFGRPDGSRCPILCVNAERKLLIAGDYYRVTNNGIEG